MEGRSRSCGHNVAIVIRVHDSLAMGLPLGRGCGYLAAIQLNAEAIDDDEERIDIREKPATRGASSLEGCEVKLPSSRVGRLAAMGSCTTATSVVPVRCAFALDPNSACRGVRFNWILEGDN